MSVLTEAKVTIWGFLAVYLFLSSSRFTQSTVPQDCYHLHVNTSPHTYTLPFPFCLVFAWFSLKMKQNKCSAAKTLTQNSPAALGSGELPDLSARTPFAC